jgi:3-methyladenine DNA glycosylase AlkC
MMLDLAAPEKPVGLLVPSTRYCCPMADAPLLKDFVDVESVQGIASAIASAAPSFDQARFVADVFADGWDERALKQRIRHIAMTIRQHLSGDYATALQVMRRAARDVAGGGLAVWCLNDFVEEYGVDDPDISLPALEQFTRLASAEFAVRPFLARYPERMAAQMLEWAHSDSEEVRRLASEGYRPRLPWGMGLADLKRDPSPIVPVLEVLRDDPSETVRRSVANNLNDISKDHPAMVVDLLMQWGSASAQAEALRKHALRTLLKKGDPGAMELLGYSVDVAVAVTDLSVEPGEVPIGGHVHVEFMVTSESDRPQQVMLDYAVTYQNVSGTGSRKVFKGKALELDAYDSTRLKRKISLQPMSTRRIVPGPHTVEAQVNGVVRGVADFDVID